MPDEPTAVREIHEIRERLYEEQKDWTHQERLDHINRVGAKLASKLGLERRPRGDLSRHKTG